MPKKTKQLPTSSLINPQNAILGLRGQDLVSTLRLLALQGIRQPGYSARHLARLGKQMGRILIGRSPLQPDPHDSRFQDPSWRLNPIYKRCVQAYLAWRQQLLEWADGSELADDDRARAKYLLSILIDAASPSNTLLNPQALKEVFNTGGQSLLQGLRHLLDDLLHNGGMPSQVDRKAFEVGKNLATTAGAVVFRSEVLELIQYRPMGEYLHARPLLIVPPQINKFYIFDLVPEKSFVQYALKNNLQVFIISWRNPEPRHREWGLVTYLEALDEAIEVCREITGSRSLNILGACSGGLSIAALQGHLQASRQLRKIHSATYLVSLLDSHLETPAVLFADEQTLENSKRRSYQHGVLEGREMARVFAWMRPNELVWNYWVNNYLLGKQPPAFDILYWNNDNTRLTAALHGDFLDFFKHNPLVHADCLEIKGTAVNLEKVRLDSFHVAGISDHITPWQGVYRSAQLLGGNKRFILSNSGHIQSILNPPSNPKARYFENDNLPADPAVWYQQAERHVGSWWPLWLEWIQARSGERRPVSLTLGNKAYPPLSDAPGIYVHVR